MAEYGQQSQSHTRPANFTPVSPHQREAAFASIFSAAPPPGRSLPHASQHTVHNDRTLSLTVQPSGNLPRIGPERSQPQVHLSQHQQSHNYYSSRTGPANGHSQANGVHVPPLHQIQTQTQHYLPRPEYSERRPFPPQQVDSRSGLPPSQGNAPMPTRVYPQAMISAPNSSAFRTQSLASNARPSYQSPSGGHFVSPVHSFRQQSYPNPLARTTAQGRVVPERPDERTMSMTSFSRDNDYSQTMNGRIIPNRRRQSSSLNGSDETQQVEARKAAVAPPGIAHRTSSSDSHSSRAMSMASTLTPTDRTSSITQHRASYPKSDSQSTLVVTRKRSPVVYPALLSRVADVFRERIAVGDREKNDLVYKNAFTGAEAVDLIAYIMQNTDRNLALLLGRSLDHQKFFHDVTYDHRLRDSPNEVYQLRETLPEDGIDVNGVFTLTTECYSPTCTPDKLCYSIACPRRVDQQKRLNMKPQSGLKREDSRASLHEDHNDEQKLWINTVSKEVADSVNDKEKKRQEVISELMYTERDFVKDLEYLRDFWMKPLKSGIPGRPSPVPEHRREKFIRTVFSNCQEVYSVNSKMAEALTRRQQQEPVVRNVGDIFLKFIPRFAPFIVYGANQMFGKYEFEREKQQNPHFSRFVDEVERLKESRKLELNGYLTKPTTRLARYPLLLEGILKYTADDNPDKEDIPKAVAAIKDVLGRVNAETGKSENKFNLMMLNKQLVWRAGEYVDLKLTEENRQLLFKSPLKKSPTDAVGDITGYLFDNALLFAKTKMINKREELKVYKKPIPLGLLVMVAPDDLSLKIGMPKRQSSGLITTRSNQASFTRSETTKQSGYPITFRHLGKGGFEQSLYCSSQIQREKWFAQVDGQQNALREKSNMFTKTELTEGFSLSAGMRVNCCVPIDGGRKLVIGTDVGVFITERKPNSSTAKPRRVLDVKSVTQVDVLEQHSIVLVLTDKTLYSYAIEALDPDESPLAPSKRGRKISHANFFKTGVFDGQHLVCCVRTTSLSTTIKLFKPTDSMTNSKKKSGLAKMLAGGQEVLKPHKEFYIPTETYSIHFLKSSLCAGCARGFEIVNLETLMTQSLLDQADTSLDFVAMKENVRPIHVERINRDFLLCYSDFCFFVDRHGWRAKPDWKIMWEGNPQAFAIFGPYILAFEPSFIEIRNMDTEVVYILTARNVRMLHSSTREILYAYEDDTGEDVVASLDFWGKSSDSVSSATQAVTTVGGGR